MFPDEPGRVTHPNAISNQFVVRRKAASIPVGSIHVLRHYVDGWVMWPAASFPLLGLPGALVPAT